MKRFAIMITAAIGLASSAIASAQTANYSDLAYCNALSDTYIKYIGRDETSPRRVVRSNSGDATGYVAVAQCRQGNASASIPVLERELIKAKFTLPARG